MRANDRFLHSTSKQLNAFYIDEKMKKKKTVKYNHLYRVEFFVFVCKCITLFFINRELSTGK